MNESAEERDQEIQDAIDLVSFGKPASVRCPNCGVYRTVGNDKTFPYLVETCRQCGDDGYDLLDDSGL